MKIVEPKMFGPYRAVAHLDTGGMAEVYLAHNPDDNSLAVVKLLLEPFLEQAELMEMFRQEAAIMTNLDHPNVVKVLGAGDYQDGRPYIVMEYLAGDHLGILFRAAQKHRQKMPCTLVTRIAIQVANGLAYVHAAKDLQGNPLGLVHRDISPQNIFLCYDGRIKLLDFGIALVSGRRQATRAGTIKGKLSYMSPQQITRQALDGRSDLFSLGIVIWQLLTGVKLFKGKNEYKILKMIRDDPIPAPRDIRPDIPKALDSIVMHCLEREPENRIQDAVELRSALTSFLFYGDKQGRPNELQLFAENVLAGRKRKKAAIVNAVQHELALKEFLFGDLEDELPAVEIDKNENDSGGSYTPVEEAKRRATPVSEQIPAAGECHCDWCGAEIDLVPGRARLCAACQESAHEVTLVECGPEWTVRKPDFRTLGPLTTRQVLRKFEAGEISAGDMLAKSEDRNNFRLISSYPEFKPFFKRPSQEYRPQEEKRGFGIGPVRGVPAMAAAATLVLALALGLGIWLWPKDKQAHDDIYQSTLTEFSREIPSPSGTTQDLLEEGRKLFLLDRRDTYRRADKILKTAILLDHDNPEALAAWVLNRAMLDFVSANVTARKTCLDLIEYARRRWPGSNSLLRAKAYLFFSLGNTVQARITAGAAMRAGDNDPLTALVMSATQLESSPQQAADSLGQVIADGPEIMLAYRLQSKALMRQGRFQRAIETLEARLIRSPGEYETMIALAEIRRELGQAEVARDMFERIHGLEPLRPEPVIAMARLESRLFRRPRRARKTLTGFLQNGDKIAPADRAMVLCERSIIERLLGDYEHAEKDLDLAAGLTAPGTSALYARAVLEINSKRGKSALEITEKLRPLLPQSARLLARMADANCMAHDFDKAMRSLKMAHDMQPDDLDVLLMLASLNLFLDNSSDAFENLQKATILDPFLSDSHQTLSDFFDGPGLLRKTAQRMSEALQKYSDIAQAHALMGIVLLRLERPRQARRSLRQALDLDQNCFPANLYMGVCELSRHKPRRALPYLIKAHDLRPTLVASGRLLARAMFEAHQHGRAKKAYLDLLQDHPDDAGALLGLSRVYLAEKKKRLAGKTLEKAYRADVDNIDTRRLLYQMGR